MPALRLHGGAAHEVIASIEAHLDRIGLARLQSFQHEVRVGVQDDHAIRRILVQADHLGLQLTAHTLLEAETGLVVARTRARKDLASRYIEIAGDGHEVYGYLPVLHTIGLLISCQAPLDSGGLCRRVHASRLVDQLHGNIANLRSLLGGHRCDTLGKLLEAIAPVLHEIVVVEILFDDDVAHRHTECRIRTRAKLQMNISASRKPRDTRINDNETGSATHGVYNSMAEEAVGVGFEWSLAPNDKHFGQIIARVVPATGKRTGVVPFGIGSAADIGDGGKTRRIACVTRLRIAEVRRAKAHGAIGCKRTTLTTRTRKYHDRLASVLVGDAIVLFLDDVEGLFPRNLLPRVGITTVLRVALHRMQKASGIVDVVPKSNAPRAKPALSNRIVLVAFDTHELAVLVDIEFEATTNGMASRRRPGARTGNRKAILLITPWLSDVVHIGKGIELDNSCGLVEIVFAHVTSFLSFPGRRMHVL